MRTIGLLGGMSWESTAVYYRLLNEAVRDRSGGLSSADVLLRSVDFAPVEAFQRGGDWAAAGDLLAREARTLAGAGAELIVLCTNTMHQVADQIADAVDVPFVHIADATGDAARAAGVQRLGLLATAYTMERRFYRGHLEDRYGLEVLVPDEAGRRDVHRVIYEELCRGIVLEASRARFREVMTELAERGAQAIVLGCTEIDLLVGPQDADVPLLDSTELHVRAALALAQQDTDAERAEVPVSRRPEAAG